MSQVRPRRSRGEGSITTYLTASGIRYRIGWRERADPEIPGSKSKQRFRGGFHTESEAAVELRKILVRRDEGLATAENTDAFGSYARTWLDGRRLAPTTAAGYARNLRLHIEPNIGHLRVSQVRAHHLAAMYRNLEKSGSHSVRPGEKGKGLGPNTVLKVHALVRTILQSAVQDGELVVNPADLRAAEPPTTREVTHARPAMTVWELDEMSAADAWLATSPHRMAPMFRLLLSTGLRRGEVVGLRWADLAVDDQRLIVRRGVTRSHAKGEKSRINVGPPKSGKPRTLDLDAETFAMLKGHRDAMGREGFDRLLPDRPMFPNGDGEMYYPDAVYRLWDAIQERMLKYLELPKITVHEIRHSYATALLRMGRAVYEVQDRLGHSTSAITQDLYAHVTPRSSRNLAESFAQALRNIDGGSDAVGPVGPLGASHDHSQTLE